jgi:hypothetical protein
LALEADARISLPPPLALALQARATEGKSAA